MVPDGVLTDLNQLKASGADRTACHAEASSKSEPFDRAYKCMVSGVGWCGES